MHYYFDPLKKYAVFTGRSTRKEFWIFSVLSTLTIFLLLIVGLLIDIMMGTFYFVGPVEIALPFLFALFIVIPTFAIMVRRLHDTNHSGWWVLIPVLGTVFSLSAFILGFFKLDITSGIGDIFDKVIGVAEIIVFIFFVMKSTPGTNKYGPNPKEVIA